jgi:hypothetical protein
MKFFSLFSFNKTYLYLLGLQKGSTKMLALKLGLPSFLTLGGKARS